MSLEKVLIAYATRYGSTETIARDIEKRLNENGIVTQRVDLKTTRLKDLDPITSFKGVIVGASVAMFRVHPALKKFLKAIKKDLRISEVPLVLFVASGTAIKEPAKAHDKFIQKIIDRYGLEPALTQAVEPCMTMSTSTKPNVKAICKSLAEEAGIEFDPEGMNDMRNEERFGAFLYKVVEIMS